jgi:hypothetical protein
MLDETIQSTDTQVEAEPQAIDQNTEPSDPIMDAYRKGLNPEPQKVTEEWTKDKRFGTIYKTPDDVYKAHREMEKMFNPLQDKVKEYEQKINEYSQLQGKLTEYESKINQYQPLEQYINYLDQNPQYGGKVKAVLEEINKEIRRNQYGADLPDEIVRELEESRRFREEAAREKEKAEFERTVSQGSEVAKTQLTEIDQIASKFNIDFDKSEFIEWAIKKDFSPNELKARFIEHALPEIEKFAQVSGEKRVINNINSNRKAAISGSGTRVTPTNNTKSLDDALFEAYRK